MSESRNKELGQFSEIWKGGYFEGDPLDRMGYSGYNRMGFNSVLFTTFVACIKPYVNSETTALEIGPGRGGWTRSILSCGPRKVIAVDAATAEHTGFWSYVGQDSRVDYLVASDFSLSAVADGSITYFFSFGVFCHIPPEFSKQYMASLYRVMAPNSHGFLMVADFDKVNQAAANLNALSTRRALPGTLMLPLRLGYDLLAALRPQKNIQPINPESPVANGVGRWHHFGVDEVCAELERLGFSIADRDMDVNPRDPVIHFIKP
jgi:hypothetical protein